MSVIFISKYDSVYNKIIQNDETQLSHNLSFIKLDFDVILVGL